MSEFLRKIRALPFIARYLARRAATRRERAIGRALKEHAAEIAQLRSGLAANVIQDAFYANFPRLPARSIKQTRVIGPYRVKIFISTVENDRRVAIILRHGSTFLGTLVLTRDIDRSILVLPEGEPVEEAAERLFAALARVANDDAASRIRAA